MFRFDNQFLSRKVLHSEQKTLIRAEERNARFRKRGKEDYDSRKNGFLVFMPSF